jgi:hypothetical protein
MAVRKSTIRRMRGCPNTRALARAINQVDSGIRKIRKLLPQIESYERDSALLYKARSNTDLLYINPLFRTAEELFPKKDS